MDTRPETKPASSPLKIAAWETSFCFWEGLCSGARRGYSTRLWIDLWCRISDINSCVGFLRRCSGCSAIFVGRVSVAPLGDEEIPRCCCFFENGTGGSV